MAREKNHSIHSVGASVAPTDPLNAIFTPEVLGAWRSRRNPSPDLRFRLEVLEARGPHSWHDSRPAQKAMWETYLRTAFARGMFDGDRGKDLRAHLTNISARDFRSAMAECEACWFLAERMGLRVNADARGRDGKNLDMRIIISGSDDIGVEVKAPFCGTPPIPPGRKHVIWVGGDDERKKKITQCLKKANRQFSDEQPNILVIVPNWWTTTLFSRDDFIRAAYGGHRIIVPVNLGARKSEPPQLEFCPEGKFLNTTTQLGGGALKSDGMPACRRVSAILCIQETCLCVDHDVFVLHNPCAYRPLTQEFWKNLPQLIWGRDRIEWTDGYEIHV